MVRTDRRSAHGALRLADVPFVTIKLNHETPFFPAGLPVPLKFQQPGTQHMELDILTVHREPVIHAAPPRRKSPRVHPGAAFGQELPPADMRALIDALGRTPYQRTTHYVRATADRAAAAMQAAPLGEVVNPPPRLRPRRRDREVVLFGPP